MICTVMGGLYHLLCHTAWPGKALLSCELLVIPAAAAAGTQNVSQNVHKTPTSPKSRKEGHYAPVRCAHPSYFSKPNPDIQF